MVPGTRPASETSWLAVFRVPRTPAQPAGHNPGSRRPFLIIVKLEDHDIRAPILGMGREVASSRRIRVLFKTTTNRHDLQRTVLLCAGPADGAWGPNFILPSAWTWTSSRMAPARTARSNFGTTGSW